MAERLRDFGWALVLLVAGCWVDGLPRRFSSDGFVAWYNRRLENWGRDV